MRPEPLPVVRFEPTLFVCAACRTTDVEYLADGFFGVPTVIAFCEPCGDLWLRRSVEHEEEEE